MYLLIDTATHVPIKIDKVTEDDIKLIEDILKQITDGTGTK